MNDFDSPSRGMALRIYAYGFLAGLALVASVYAAFYLGVSKMWIAGGLFLAAISYAGFMIERPSAFASGSGGAPRAAHPSADIVRQRRELQKLWFVAYATGVSLAVDVWSNIASPINFEDVLISLSILLTFALLTLQALWALRLVHFHSTPNLISLLERIDDEMWWIVLVVPAAVAATLKYFA